MEGGWRSAISEGKVLMQIGGGALPDYSPLMFASLMTLPHLSDSAFMKAAASAGVLPTGRAPWSANFFCISGDFTILTIWLLIRWVSSGESPAGAMTMYHSSAS